MNKLRVLLADDHQMIREGLKAVLSSETDIEVISEAHDGHTVVEQAVACKPDVVVMDISMPLANGLRATAAIRDAVPSAKVLAYTRHAEPAYIQQLIDAGASGYLLKQSRASELPHAIRSVAAGRMYLDPEIAAKVIRPLVGRSHPAGHAASASISQREEEVLRMVAWGHATRDIASKLNLSVKTVETHKARAMQKLGLGSRLDIIRFALLHDWLQEP